MPVVRSRIWILGVIPALLAGCGGGASIASGGGGGGNNPTTMTLTFAGTAMPQLVAAKIGTGAYSAQTLSGSTLTLSLPSGTSTYAVAYLCPAVGSGQYSSQFEYVWEASITDGSQLYLHCPYAPNLTPNLTGSLDASAIQGVQSFEILAQNGSSVGGGGANGPTGSFNIAAPTGTDRVLALAYGSQPGFDSQGAGPVAAKDFDNQTVPGSLNGGNTVVFTASDETTPEPITYNNVPSGFSTPSTYAWLGMGQTAQNFVYATHATTQYMQLPPSATEKGDVYFLDANASSTSSEAGVNTEIVSSGGPVSFTFPTPWSYSGPTAAALPSFTMNYPGFSGQANVSENAWIFWGTGSGGIYSTSTDDIQIEATANYQAGSTTLAVPDLSGVAGFMAPPASGTQVEWDAWIEQQSWAFASPVPSNAVWSTVSNVGLYTVP
jgi:hypothetical protein